ncbi:MAG TPA: alpha/beta hydrolase fold domain-containing protein [Ramlibacter sp.]|uniref:alpha/beta hydrolase fold domain-containing protein n=1 Tax=Ramlibacter sp. TaxID=1917967 RepID=UPI002BD52C1E|nr:alpha/beta hydrolase fold domain-containing protein [Ramlibacter sp.]HVZ45423.1 alpha/beta hydrolase fold domain-containing protein [Ramlibacter sp.]
MSSPASPSVWILDRSDNVGSVVGVDAASGARCAMRGAATGQLEVRQDIPHGHKVALRAIAAGDPVIKYGARVGRMTADVAPGEHVHVHNMESLRGRGDIAVAQGDPRAQYEPRSTVTASYLERFRVECAEASVAARKSLPCTLDVAFGEAAGDRLDLFWSERREQAPLCVFLHGGFWRSNRKEDFSYVATGLTQAGMNVAIVDYDLIPSVRMSRLVDQCRDAVAWLARNAGRLGLRDGSVFLCGHSAGAHVAAMLLSTDWAARASDLPRDFIRGAIGLSGLYDLAPVQQAPINQTLALTDQEVRDFSPVNLSPRVQCAFELLVGSAETTEFQRQSDLLADRWKSGITAPRVRRIANANHYSIRGQLGDARSEVTKLVRELCVGGGGQA